MFDNPIDLKPGQEREDYKPEPRDLLQVICDYIRRVGTQAEVDNFTESWVHPFEDPLGLVKVLSQDEYTDVLIVDALGLNVEDNSFTGVIFRKGDIKILEQVFLFIKPLVEAEGGRF